MSSRKSTTAGPSKRRRQGREIDPRALEPTFFNQQAKEAFQSSVKRRQCIPERGMLNPMNEVWKIIDERHWEMFTSEPMAAAVPVVREFYANAKEQLAATPRNFMALVRGKQVPYDSQTINQYYTLEDIEEDEYTAWSDEGVDDEEVIQSIAKPGARWKRLYDKAVNFPISSLKAGSRAWHLFISAKLLPSKHVSEVTRERAAVNYAIQNGLSIDVGKLIQKSIVACIHGRGGLGHPSLIYALCLHAGVQENPAEEVQLPLPAITGAKIFGWEKHDRDEVPHPEHEQAATTSARPKASLASLDKQLQSVSLRVDDLAQNQKLIMKAQRRMMAEQRQQYSYFSEYTTSLNSMFQNCSQFQGASSVAFPTPPTFSPLDEDEEEESEEEDEDESEEEEEDE